MDVLRYGVPARRLAGMIRPALEFEHLRSDQIASTIDGWPFCFLFPLSLVGVGLDDGYKRRLRCAYQWSASLGRRLRVVASFRICSLSPSYPRLSPESLSTPRLDRQDSPSSTPFLYGRVELRASLADLTGTRRAGMITPALRLTRKPPVAL